jgi:hypothetical protein
MKAALLVALVALVGCSGTRRGSTYSVLIDPAFTSAQAEMIVEAAQEWADGTGATMVPVISPCHGMRDATICMVAVTSQAALYAAGADQGDPAVGHTQTHRDWVDFVDGGISLIDTVDGAAYIRPIAAHEMGHAMGLGHLPNPDALMYRGVQAKSHVTDMDVAEWHAVR